MTNCVTDPPDHEDVHIDVDDGDDGDDGGDGDDGDDERRRRLRGTRTIDSNGATLSRCVWSHKTFPSHHHLSDCTCDMIHAQPA